MLCSLFASSGINNFSEAASKAPWVEIGIQALRRLSREGVEVLGCTDTDDDKPAVCQACRQIYQMIKAVSPGSNILSPAYIPILYDIVNPQVIPETPPSQD